MDGKADNLKINKYRACSLGLSTNIWRNSKMVMLLLSRFSHVRLCVTPDGSPPGSPVPGPPPHLGLLCARSTHSPVLGGAGKALALKEHKKVSVGPSSAYIREPGTSPHAPEQKTHPSLPLLARRCSEGLSSGTAPEGDSLSGSGQGHGYRLSLEVATGPS